MIQKKKLGEIANISAGQGAPQGAENYSEEGTPFVKAGDLFYLVNGERECDIQKVSEEVAKNHRLKLYPKGTVLFAKSGMSCMKGYVYATNAECYVVSHLACIMPFDVDSKYLKYYFEYHKPNQLVKDASYPSISLADIAEMPINVFDDQTEAKIVDNLDAVNSLIAKSKEELGLLDNIVKSRFVEMFGAIPESEFVTMESVCSLITDGTHQPPKFVDNGIPFLFVSNITTNELTYDADKFISSETYADLMKRTPVEIGDILLSTVGSYGHPAVVKSDRKFSFQRHIAFLKPRRDVINSIYLHGVILTSDIQRQIDARVKGIAQKTLNLSEIRTLRFPLPPMKEQNRFAAFVAEVDKSKLAVKQSLEKLETLKKSLMQQYFG